MTYRNRNTITLLTLIIVLLSIFAAGYGVFSEGGPGEHQFQSLHGDTVTLHGKGLYRNDSVSAAAQEIAQDIVTLALGVPLLLLSLSRANRSLRGRLLLAGTLGFFLYTYTSYAFLSTYNPLFLVYVTLMSCSFFAFTLTMMSFDLNHLQASFSDKLPVRTLGSFLIVVAVLIGLMWLGRIVPPLMSGGTPEGLEHYTTLVIQVLDLGFIVPVGILSGVLLIRRKPFGFLLASVIILKGITMATSISAMIIGMVRAGEEVALAEMLVFPLVNLGFILLMITLLKHVKEVRVP